MNPSDVSGANAESSGSNAGYPEQNTENSPTDNDENKAQSTDENRDISDASSEYDHSEAGQAEEASADNNDTGLLVDITMEGGSGKAYIQSPVKVSGSVDDLTAEFIWSSPNYDYMIVNGIRYDNENPGGDSTFTIPVNSLKEPLSVIADTVAMSTPHEIEYTINWGEVHSGGSGEGNGSTNTADNNTTGTAKSSGNIINKSDGNTNNKIAGNTGNGDVNSLKDSEDTDRLQKQTPSHIGKYAKTGDLKLNYARQFSISSYGKLKLISIVGSGDYLLIPEGCEIPDDIPADMVILKQPLDRTYLVSTSVMDLICECGALDMLKYSGTKAGDWYIEAAKEAMDTGKMLYAGKYRAPDYELILSGGCNLAIENTMIYHNPEVKEKLEELGIPVLVETSSYEEHPLGRLEWIKLYGVLFGKEDTADEYYEKQLRMLEPIMNMKNTGVSTAFFHITVNGLVNVRKPGDYISTMIELAGGEYIPGASNEKSSNGKTESSGSSSDSSAVSSMNMQPEDFYASAYDADILIYNSTITGEIHSVNELIKKNALFKDFKAVKEGRVYCTKPELFQKTTGIADFMKDLNNIFTGNDKKLIYLTKLD